MFSTKFILWQYFSSSVNVGQSIQFFCSLSQSKNPISSHFIKGSERFMCGSHFTVCSKSTYTPVSYPSFQNILVLVSYLWSSILLVVGQLKDNPQKEFVVLLRFTKNPTSRWSCSISKILSTVFVQNDWKYFSPKSNFGSELASLQTIHKTISSSSLH